MIRIDTKPTKINIRPLSVNRVWAGRRFKTQDYKDYEHELSLLLPNDLKIPSGELTVGIVWGFSSRASDVDNPTKPFIDVLQKKYGFNDKQIVNLILKKEYVKKGEEFIAFTIKS